MSGLEARVITGRLLTILDEAFHGASGPVTYFVDNRPGFGLLGSFGNLDAASASRAVGGSSIAAHVEHVVFAMEASADWITGDRTPRDWKASWRASAVDDETWPLLLERLHHEYQQLRAAIEEGAMTSEDAFGEAVGAIAHVAYHLGSVRQKLAVLGETSRTGVA
jgi:hypothetical protein